MPLLTRGISAACRRVLPQPWCARLISSSALARRTTDAAASSPAHGIDSHPRATSHRTQVMDILRRELNMEGAASPVDWRTVTLADPVLKFKILSETTRVTGRAISNLELNNTHTAADLLQLVSTPRSPASAIHPRQITVQRQLASTALPPNMQWIPAERVLRERRYDAMKDAGVPRAERVVKRRVRKVAKKLPPLGM